MVYSLGLQLFVICLYQQIKTTTMETGTAKFKKGEEVYYCKEDATITGVKIDGHGSVIYSLKYYPINGDGKRLRHGAYGIDENHNMITKK